MITNFYGCKLNELQVWLNENSFNVLWIKLYAIGRGGGGIFNRISRILYKIPWNGYNHQCNTNVPRNHMKLKTKENNNSKLHRL